LHSPRFFPFNQAEAGKFRPVGVLKGKARQGNMLQEAQTADAVVKDTTTQTFVKDVI